MSKFDDILGKTSKDGDDDDLAALVTEPDSYRPYLTRSQPQIAFVLVEGNGTMHGFQYHTLRHPKYERDDEGEYLSFTADGVAVVMQGTGLQRIFREMMRYTLLEVRAFDGKPIADATTRITKLEVRDAHDQLASGSPARLVVK